MMRDAYAQYKVKEGDGALPCEVGQPMACGSTIRLEHVNTGKNLHSHSFKSPLTRGQEVCLVWRLLFSVGCIGLL